MDSLYTSIGRRIRRLRKRRRWTQVELAERADISTSFLGHIERGSRKLSVETLNRIALALNCSADALLGTGLEAQLDLPLLLAVAAERLEEGRDGGQEQP